MGSSPLRVVAYQGRHCRCGSGKYASHRFFYNRAIGVRRAVGAAVHRSKSGPLMSASLIGHSGSSAFRLSTTTVSMSLTGSCFSSESSPGALPSWDSRTRWNNLSGALTGAEPSGLGGHPAGGSRPKRKVPLRCRLCRNERFRRSGASFWWAQVRPEAPIRLIARRGAGVVAFDLAPLVFDPRTPRRRSRTGVALGLSFDRRAQAGPSSLKSSMLEHRL